jgi:hypothetical protein
MRRLVVRARREDCEIGARCRCDTRKNEDTLVRYGEGEILNEEESVDAVLRVTTRSYVT